MKKILATLLAIVMVMGSFSMVSFAAEDAVTEEKETVNVVDVIETLIGLINGKEADEEISIGDTISALIDVATGKADADFDVGAIVDLVLGLAQGQDDSFDIQDILDLVDAVANGEADFDGNGELDVYDLISLIESKVSEDADDGESAMIVTIVFKVIRIFFNLLENFFAA